MAIETTPEWNLVANWIGGVWFAPKPNKQQALLGMEKFLTALKAENLTKNEEMASVLTTFIRTDRTN